MKEYLSFIYESRYINRQQHHYSCGPTAVMNALKWLGVKVKYRCDINNFLDYEYKHSEGMYNTGVKKAFKDYGYDIKRKVYVTIPLLKEELLKGNAIVLNYNHRIGGHYLFIKSYNANENRFEVHNDSRLDASMGDPNKLSEDFKRAKKRNDPPEMWIIPKKYKI